MYIDTLAYQTRVFLYAYGFGFILGVLYDAFRILRLLVYNGRKRVFIWDIMFALVASFLTVIFALAVCKGIFGFYLLPGMGLGFLTYRFVFGGVILTFTNKLITRIKNRLSILFQFFKKAHIKISPRINKKVRRDTKKICKKSKKSKNKSKNLLQVDKVMLYNNEE